MQRRLQTRSEGRRHQLRRLGGCSCRPRQLEARRRNRDPDKQEEDRRPVGRLERAQMTEYDSNSTYRAKHGHVDLSKLQQSLSIKNRIVQPQQALQLNQTLISWRIFHCLQKQDTDIYMYVCIYTHKHTHAHAHTHTHTYIYIYIYIYYYCYFYYCKTRKGSTREGSLQRYGY